MWPLPVLKKQLYFSHCKMRYRFGEENRQMRSRFLDEVDPGVVRTETGATIKQNKNRFSEGEARGSSDTTVEYDWKKPKQTKKPSHSNIDYETHYDDDPYQAGVTVVHPTFGPEKSFSERDRAKIPKLLYFLSREVRKP